MAAINIAKNQVGLDEETYRAMLVRVTGKDSLRLMTSTEQDQVLDELRSKGAPQHHSKMAGPYGAKLQALWISGYHLGLVRNRSNAALQAFVKGRTGIDHTRFLRNAQDARKAVEALKSWLNRDGGVDWSERTDPRDCVIAAQIRTLGADVPLQLPTDTNERMQKLGELIRARPSA